MKHNPFSWVHSEFGFLVSVILFFVAFVYTSFKPVSPINTFYEWMLALNALFWLKQYGKGKQEIEKIKLNGAASQAGKIGDPLK